MNLFMALDSTASSLYSPALKRKERKKKLPRLSVKVISLAPPPGCEKEGRKGK
jgi:hypothetical protein